MAWKLLFLASDPRLGKFSAESAGGGRATTAFFDTMVDLLAPFPAPFSPLFLRVFEVDVEENEEAVVAAALDCAEAQWGLAGVVAPVFRNKLNLISEHFCNKIYVSKQQNRVISS